MGSHVPDGLFPTTYPHQIFRSYTYVAICPCLRAGSISQNKLARMKTSERQPVIWRRIQIVSPKDKPCQVVADTDWSERGQRKCVQRDRQLGSITLDLKIFSLGLIDQHS
jgi:hypothetical protein